MLGLRDPQRWNSPHDFATWTNLSNEFRDEDTELNLAEALGAGSGTSHQFLTLYRSKRPGIRHPAQVGSGGRPAAGPYRQQRHHHAADRGRVVRHHPSPDHLGKRRTAERVEPEQVSAALGAQHTARSLQGCHKPSWESARSLRSTALAEDLLFRGIQVAEDPSDRGGLGKAGCVG